MSSIDELLGVMQRLRDPDTGCAWDLQQNFKTIAPYTIEEAYEVADAIEREDLDDLRDELGDLLLQVVFHSQLAMEQGAFDFGDVVKAISDKMIRRHPHVFADTEFANEAEMKAAWEAEKARERAARQSKREKVGEWIPASAKASALDDVALNLPALKRADKLQKRASRVGFDWPDIDPVWEKLQEEINELAEAHSLKDPDAIEDEMGDLLFTAVNLARFLSVDAETALRRASLKFSNRFRHVELLASEQSRSLPDLDLDELDRLWREAKSKDGIC